jgi:hypothetical protein
MSGAMKLLPPYMPTRHAPLKNFDFFHGATDPTGTVPHHYRGFTITLKTHHSR